MRRLGVLALLVLVAGVRSAAADVLVSGCAQTVPAGTIGRLATDLDCATSAFGVRLLAGATLDLNGHALAGGDLTMATVLGVGTANGLGRARFTIMGPGEISGTSRNYNFPSGTSTCVQVNDGKARITSATGVVDIHGCIYGITGSAGVDVNGHGKVLMDHVDLHGLLYDGAAVGALVASDVVASDNGGQGLGAALKTVVTNVVVQNNLHGHGVFAGTNLRGSHVVASGNYSGAEAWRTLKVDDLSATGNAYTGAVGGVRLMLTNSTVTGSGFTDILSKTPPKLVDTTCGRSLSFDDVSWHVCNGSPSGAFLDRVR